MAFEKTFDFILQKNLRMRIFCRKPKYNRNMNSKQYTFSDFTKKTVINVCDGRELGHVCDLVFNNRGAILAIIVPGKKSLFKSLTSSENLIIPFNRIVKIGSDVILTDVVGNMASVCATPPRTQTRQAAYAPPPPPPQDAYAQPYRDDYAGAEYTAQAYSMPAEPMYRADDAPDPQPTPEPDNGAQSAAQTYYHTD